MKVATIDAVGMWIVTPTDFHVFLRIASRPFTGMYQQEHLVSINKDRVKGGIEEAKGSIKEASGKLVGDKKLEAKGNVQKNLGKVEKKLGDIKQNAKGSLK